MVFVMMTSWKIPLDNLSIAGGLQTENRY
uniref:Ribose-phosphate pyrophosphokinase 1 n=1 Tax=Rhizophora mucronata TaxID=61149 RepID=A0A2P2KZ91_RHIMU